MALSRIKFDKAVSGHLFIILQLGNLSSVAKWSLGSINIISKSAVLANKIRAWAIWTAPTINNLGLGSITWMNSPLILS